MPSVKSYQNRKAEIAALNAKLAESEYQTHKLTQTVSMLRFGIDNERETEKILRSMITRFVERETEYKKQVEGLEMQIRTYRDYIRKFYPDTVTEIIQRIVTQAPVEISSCFKPLDAIKYAAERIANGPDNLS